LYFMEQNIRQFLPTSGLIRDNERVDWGFPIVRRGGVRC
jgi:hypothetical protein